VIERVGEFGEDRAIHPRKIRYRIVVCPTVPVRIVDGSRKSVPDGEAYFLVSRSKRFRGVMWCVGSHKIHEQELTVSEFGFSDPITNRSCRVRCDGSITKLTKATHQR